VDWRGRLTLRSYETVVDSEGFYTLVCGSALALKNGGNPERRENQAAKSDGARSGGRFVRSYGQMFSSGWAAQKGSSSADGP